MTEDWRTRFRARFRELQEAEGFTQERFAEVLGVTQGTIAHWLSGRRNPKDIEEYESLAKALRIDTAYLLFGTQAPTLTKEAEQIAIKFQSLPPAKQAAIVHLLDSI